MKNEIRRIREALGLSQSQFANKLLEEEGVNIRYTAIGNYETGSRFPRPNIASAIVNLSKNYGIETSMDLIYTHDNSSGSSKN